MGTPPKILFKHLRVIIELIQILTTTGFFTILRRLPILMLRHSRMMLSHLLGVTLGFFALGGSCSGSWFPNCKATKTRSYFLLRIKQVESNLIRNTLKKSIFKSVKWLQTWSFIRVLRGIVIFMLTSSKNSVLISSWASVLFTSASTLPPDGTGEECAESAGRGETLSSLLTLPVLALSASSSSSSLERTT